MNLVILLLDACWLRVNNQRCEPDTKSKSPGSLRSHGLNGSGAALIFPVMVQPFFLWERLSAAKITPVMGLGGRFPSRLRVRQVFRSAAALSF